jgi:hypothetical protein
VANTLTRIKNNQITTASTGNTQLGISGAKIQGYTITGGLLANSLVYGSDLTVSGNLTVSGTTTNVDTVNTLIQDPLITLADGQTSGSPTVDIGTIGLRGSQNSAVLGWKESALEFVTALSTTTVSNTTFTISSYANLHTGNFIAQGTTSLVGNVIGTNTNFTGNITVGNMINNGSSTTTGNITGGNLTTAGTVTAVTVNAATIGNSGAALVGATVSAATIGNSGAALQGSTVSASGNITGGNVLYGAGIVSGTGTISAATVNAATIGNSGAALQGSTVSASGNITGANINTGGLISATSTITSAANITGANINTGGLISATSTITSAANITGANINTGGSVSATSNVTGGNVNTTSIYSATNVTVTAASGTITLAPSGNVLMSSKNINNLADPVQDQDAATKVYVDTVAQGLDPKASVVYATTASIFGSGYTYNNGTSGVGATLTASSVGNLTIDGTVVSAGQRVLIKNEVGAYTNTTTQSAAFNGIYTVTTAGSPSAAYVLTRAADFNQPAEIPSAFTFVEDGSVNADTGWVCTTNAPVTIGTTQIIFTQFSGAGSYTANTSAGLSLIGTQFNAKVDGITTSFDGGGNIQVKPSANLTTPNIGAATGTSLSVTGTVTATTLSSTANVVGGNLTTAGQVSATANITGGNILTVGIISTTGNIYGANLILTANETDAGNLTAGNLLTGGLVSATGNVTGGNLLTGGLISATSTITSAANVIGGNITTAGQVSATANITGGNILTGGLISATGNISTGANLIIAGYETVTGNITGGNILTGGLVSATGSGTFGNIVITGNSVNMLNAGGTITVNGAGANTNFSVSGTGANVFFVNGSTNSASFGSSAQTVNAIVAFNTSTSILLPVGNTGQRPATGVTGMQRFNSQLNALEIYNNSTWQTVGATVFTVIADDQFNGDGTTVNFTLSSSQTTNSCIVSINGIVQIPTTAYSVSGTTLTFTEAPAAGDAIDVREVTTTTSVISVANSNLTAIVQPLDGTNTVQITGNLNPVSNVTYNLGNATNYWNTVYATTSTVTNQSASGNVTVGGYLSVVGNLYVGNINSQANLVVSDPLVYFQANSVGPYPYTYDIGFYSDFVGNPGNTYQHTGFVRDYADYTWKLVSNIPEPAGSTLDFTNAIYDAVKAGSISAVGNVTATTFISAVGNITGGNLTTAGLITGGNITTAGVLTVNSGGAATAIINGAGNAVGNIGSSTTYFNTVFAKSTSALYADLAEKYTADADYAPGTVLVFGGTHEVTVNATDADRKVAGVVSTNPSYIMNGGLEAEHVATVALTGRVPTMVVGTVKKGDLMVAAGLGRARAEADPKVGSVIGKALEDFDGAEGTIEVVIGRF